MNIKIVGQAQGHCVIFQMAELVTLTNTTSLINNSQ